MPIVAFGIDPGPRNCGIARIVVSTGNMELREENTIITPEKYSGRDAVNYIMDEILQCWEFNSLDLIGIEDFDFQGHNITKEAHATYLLVGALDEGLRHKATIVWLRPIQWKQDLSGQRGCSDYQLRAIVNLRLGLPQKYKWSSEHSVDAASIALVAYDRYRLAQIAGVKESELRGGQAGRLAHRRRR